MNVAVDIVSDLSLPVVFHRQGAFERRAGAIEGKHPDVRFRSAGFLTFSAIRRSLANRMRGYLEAKFGRAREVDRIQADVASREGFRR